MSEPEIELTLVRKTYMSKKHFDQFLRGNRDPEFERGVAWAETLVCADTGNFDGIILDLGGGEMLFIGGDHPKIKELKEADDTPSIHAHFPEIG